MISLQKSLEESHQDNHVLFEQNYCENNLFLPAHYHKTLRTWSTESSLDRMKVLEILKTFPHSQRTTTTKEIWWDPCICWQTTNSLRIYETREPEFEINNVIAHCLTPNVQSRGGLNSFWCQLLLFRWVPAEDLFRGLAQHLLCHEIYKNLDILEYSFKQITVFTDGYPT